MYHTLRSSHYAPKCKIRVLRSALLATLFSSILLCNIFTDHSFAMLRCKFPFLFFLVKFIFLFYKLHWISLQSGPTPNNNSVDVPLQECHPTVVSCMTTISWVNNFSSFYCSTRKCITKVVTFILTVYYFIHPSHNLRTRSLHLH